MYQYHARPVQAVRTLKGEARPPGLSIYPCAATGQGSETSVCDSPAGPCQPRCLRDARLGMSTRAVYQSRRRRGVCGVRAERPTYLGCPTLETGSNVLPPAFGSSTVSKVSYQRPQGRVLGGCPRPAMLAGVGGGRLRGSLLAGHG